MNRQEIRPAIVMWVKDDGYEKEEDSGYVSALIHITHVKAIAMYNGYRRCHIHIYE